MVVVEAERNSTDRDAGLRIDVLDSMKYRKLGLPDTPAPEYQMLWHTNRLCNYNCEYCIGKGPHLDGQLARTEHPTVGKYSPDHIAKCFDATGRTWRIYLAAGGETLLHPQIVEIAEALTQNHYIELLTNLSTRNAYTFADRVNPEKVRFVTVSAHIAERESRRNGVAALLDKYLYLQDRGFPIGLLYVAYPPHLKRMPRDLEWFVKQGVKLTFARPFRGIYGGKRYPEAYTPAERSLMYEWALDKQESDVLLQPIRPFGMLCNAGYRSYQLGVDGSLWRCAHLRIRQYGNLFTQDYQLDDQPRPCIAHECLCHPETLRLPLASRAYALSLIRERVALSQPLFRATLRQALSRAKALAR